MTFDVLGGPSHKAMRIGAARQVLHVRLQTDARKPYPYSQMMDLRCETCDGLWRAYAKATTEHVHLLRDQEAAAAEDCERFRELEYQTGVAAEARERARFAIRRHLGKDHYEHADASPTEHG